MELQGLDAATPPQESRKNQQPGRRRRHIAASCCRADCDGAAGVDYVICRSWREAHQLVCRRSRIPIGDVERRCRAFHSADDIARTDL